MGVSLREWTGAAQARGGLPGAGAGAGSTIIYACLWWHTGMPLGPVGGAAAATG